MMKFAVSFIVCLGAASSACAQIDASALRSKFGAPLDRETFTVRPKIEMVVDYGPNKLVYKLQLPAGIKFLGTIPPDFVTKQQVDEVLEEVVPSESRGKELGRMSTFPVKGAPVLTVTLYEHVTISELSKNELTGGRITVAFKDAACPKYDPSNPGSPN
jgi:hypothetical protein